MLVAVWSREITIVGAYNDSHSKQRKPRLTSYDRQIINVMGSEKTNLKIMTHNVLAESFTMPSFRHVPEWVRDWKDRQPRLIAEYTRYTPDIIGLQELDRCDDLLNALNVAVSENVDTKNAVSENADSKDTKNAKNAKNAKDAKDTPPKYTAIYAKRPEPLVDGTGIFYNENALTLVEKNIIDYDKGAMMKGGDKVGCVGIIAVFKHNDTGKTFIAAATHHYWDPKRLELKHKQAEMLLFEVSQVQQRFPDAPTFIMSDFNFSPTGRDIDIPVDYSPYDKMVADYKSSYAEILGDEPDFTSLYKRGPRPLHEAKVPPRSAWALDYIFYKDAKLTGILEIPTVEKTTEINWRGIPNTVYGSDHFSLMATYRI